MAIGKRGGPATYDVKKISFMLSMKFRWRQILENGQNRYADTFQLMSEDEKDVLMYRYIKLMKWEDICMKMDYSLQHIHRIHKKALENFKM